MKQIKIYFVINEKNNEFIDFYNKFYPDKDWGKLSDCKEINEMQIGDGVYYCEPSIYLKSCSFSKKAILENDPGKGLVDQIKKYCQENYSERTIINIFIGVKSNGRFVFDKKCFVSTFSK